MREGKYTIKDLDKALDYLKKQCQNEYVRIEIDELNRLYMHGSDLSGGSIKIIVYDESTAKMPDVTKTERL
jgi:hypothetical protein